MNESTQVAAAAVEDAEAAQAIEAMIAEGGPPSVLRGDGKVEDKQRAWAVGEEDWRYDSLAELLDTYDELHAGDVVYFGDKESPDPAGWIDSDDVIEQLAARAADVGGEHAEDYGDDITREAKAELDEFLTAWTRKHAQPSFWLVSNVQQYELTPADFAGAEQAG